MAFLDPEADPLGAGFQIIQSLISVGSGGIFGLGYMEGKQKLFFLPEAHTDFIFAVVGEELGLIGTCAVLLLFLVFLWRGLRTRVNAPDSVWILSGARHHDDGLRPGIHQHERRPGADADEGNSAAVSELWRQFICRDAGGGRDSC